MRTENPRHEDQQRPHSHNMPAEPNNPPTHSVQCPWCSRSFHVLTAQQGDIVACPHCNRHVPTDSRPPAMSMKAAPTPTIVLPCPHCRHDNTIAIMDDVYHASHQLIRRPKVTIMCDHCRTEHPLRDYEREWGRKDRDRIRQAKADCKRRLHEAKEDRQHHELQAKIEREALTRKHHDAHIEKMAANEREAEHREKQLRDAWLADPHTALLLRMHNLADHQLKQLEQLNRRVYPIYVVALLTLILMAISVAISVLIMMVGR